MADLLRTASRRAILLHRRFGTTGWGRVQPRIAAGNRCCRRGGVSTVGESAPRSGMLAGVTYDPSRREFVTASTAGTFLNGEPIRAAGRAHDREAAVLISFPRRAGRPVRATWTSPAHCWPAPGQSAAWARPPCTSPTWPAAGPRPPSRRTPVRGDVAAGLFMVRQAGSW
jgi:hypothetical protein